MSIVLLAMALASSCTFTAYEIKPAPKLVGMKLDERLALQLDEGIEEYVLLMPEQGLPQLEIKGWRTAVRSGLESGIDQRFAERGEGAFVLLVEKAHPDLMVEEYAADGSAAFFSAHIEYRARLFDRAHNVIGVFEGDVKSARPFQGVTDGSPLLADAIEVLTAELMRLSVEAVASAAPAPAVQVIKSAQDAPTSTPAAPPPTPAPSADVGAPDAADLDDK